MYVAVKGGETAIANAHAFQAEQRRGDAAQAPLTLGQIEQQLGLAVDRVMGEGALYDRGLAALAIKQARGDLVEAAFLVRAYRTTLPRFGYSLPVDTARMTVLRRVSATYKDLPGGQVLGPTFDYSHRMLDFALAADAGEGGGGEAPGAPLAEAPLDPAMPHVTALLDSEGLIQPEPPAEPDAPPPGDITRDPLLFPAPRDLRLQSLARGDEGFLLALGYSVQRGYGGSHPFVGEIRQGPVAVEIVPEELGFAIDIGDIDLTECEMVNQFKGSRLRPPQFTRGYGLVFGWSERKAMAMSLVDRALRAGELGEERRGPAQDEEFVLYHADNVEGAGFVTHLKLPHYVDFQSELELIRRLRAEAEARLARASAEERAAADAFATAAV
ncbi:MAG: carbon-phosphorus lyase complex subunit PhnI [Alphaproteobacteria bacterium]|nr:carbon-phosphorus lyase complex subunit PhnI [Alphaproteobacteria bacterium]